MRAVSLEGTLTIMEPLTGTTYLTSWRLDIPTLIVILALGISYSWASLRLAKTGHAAPTSRIFAFLGLGLGVWLLVTMSFVGAYADILFWVRALQVIVLLMVVPFGLAMGTPVRVLRSSLGPSGQARVDAAVASRGARILTYPATTSIVILATPWLLYFTGWYPAVVENSAVDLVTRFGLVLIGFVYFYSRLQADLIPHRYSQLISMVITFAEVIVDAVLGLVVWLGPLIAPEHYGAIGRTWGPSVQTDQIVGAGILWILGDVVGLPFLFALMRAFTKDEQRNAALVDAELDAEIDAEHDAPLLTQLAAPASTLWWEQEAKVEPQFKKAR